MENKNYNEKYCEIRRKNTYKKVQVLQNVFNDLFLHKSEKDIMSMLSHCGHYHYGRITQPLNEETKVMYEYLVTHNYNPYTVYKWFLLFLNQNLIEGYIEDSQISHDKLRRVVNARKTQRELATTWQFMEEARKTVMEMMLYV